MFPLVLSRYRRVPPRLHIRLVSWTVGQAVYLNTRRSQLKSTAVNEQVNTPTTNTIGSVSWIASELLGQQENVKDHAVIMQRLDDAIRNKNAICIWLQCQALIRCNALTELSTEKAVQIFDMLETLNTELLPYFMLQVMDTGLHEFTNRQYAYRLRYALKTGGVDAMMEWYHKFQSKVLARKSLLRIVHQAVTGVEYSYSVKHTVKLLRALLKVDRPWFKPFYPNLVFTVIIRSRLTNLEIYKLAREKMDTMDRMLYINLFGWLTVRSPEELELIQLLYEDFVRNGYVLSPNTYMRLFSEFLRAEQHKEPDFHKGITPEQRANFLYQLFLRQADSNIFPVANLTSLLIRLLIDVGQYENAEKIYRLYVTHNPRSFVVDAAYIRVLFARNNTDEIDAFYHDMFDCGFRKLPDGQYIGANGETIIFCGSGTAALIDPNYAKQHQSSITNAYEEDLEVKDQQKPTRERMKMILTQYDKEFVSESPEIAHILQQKIICRVACSVTKYLIVEYRKKHNYQKFLKAYRRFEEIGFFDMNVYALLIWGLKDAGQYALLDEIFEAMKKHHLLFPSIIAGPYIERLIMNGDMEAAEQALHTYLATREYTQVYDVGNPSTTDPGHLFMLLIAKYTELGQTEKAQALMDLGYSLPFVENSFITSGLLKGVIAKESPEEFIALVNTLDVKGLVNSDPVYALIISHFVKLDQLDSATYWYERGCADGLEMQGYMFGCGLQLYSHKRQSDKFMELYSKGRHEHRIEIDPGILSILCDGAGFMFTVKELEMFWQDALKDGFIPTENNYSSLVEAYWRLGELDRAVKVLLEDMPAAGFIPNYYMLVTLLKTANRQNNQKLVALLRETRTKYADIYDPLAKGIKSE